MQSTPPFVYLATLARSGSTLLSETLSQIPYTFIFFEPHIGKNYFALNEIDSDLFLRRQIDIRRFLNLRLMVAFVYRRLRFLGYPQDFMMREFKYKLLPKLQTVVSQIGVKEIKHRGWENYFRHFPEMKVVVTGRDPRDIYLSFSRLHERGNLNWKKGRFQGDKKFNPTTVAHELNREFKLQQQLLAKTDHFLLRYEEFCQNPSVIEQVIRFIQSPLVGIGSVGAFTSLHPKMRPEFRLHGTEITTKQVYQWKRISDRQKLKEAHQLFDMMHEYARFWGYD